MDSQKTSRKLTFIGLFFLLFAGYPPGEGMAFSGSSDDHSAIMITGTVVDASDGDPLPGVNIAVQGRIVGTASRNDGSFSLTVTGNPPITLVVSIVGYQTREVEITENEISGLVIELEERTLLGSDIVVSASRVEESVMEAPVTVEKMDIISMNQTPSDSYYKALSNLKGVDMTTSSINFQILNSRGFNSTGNTRMVQLIDGMDTQAPALNFPIGNLNGPSQLDLESVEYIPGAASALYGPNAFSGVLLMTSKNPFRYQGLSVQVKTGVNHLDGNERLGEPSDPQSMYDLSVRYAKAFNDRFAFKANLTYSGATDWHGINYDDKNPGLQGNLGVNPAYDGIHLYGDDGSFNIGLLGFSSAFIQGFAAQTGLPLQQAQMYAMALPAQPVNRTGYQERHLVDYNAENIKMNGSLHYRLSDLVEASYTFNYGFGTSVYTGAQRYSLKDFNIAQHKLELRGDNFLIKGYGTFEDSGDSYIADFVGFSVNEAYSPNQQWFGTYGGTFAGALLQKVIGVTGSPQYNQDVINGIMTSPEAVTQIHMAARNAAEANRIEPGTPAFESAREAAMQNVIPQGALFDDESRFLHFEGHYDFKNEMDFLDLLIGASYRQFQLRSNGTIFDDAGGVNIGEWGGFLQASKSLIDDRLKLTGAVRYDKNENFDGQLSPRISAVANVAADHHLRTSYQTGFRNPTTQGQYIDLNVVTARLLGGLPQFADKYSITQSTFKMESVQDFTNSVLTGAPNPGLLERYSTHNPVKPEQIQVFEVGYKALFGSSILFDIVYYHNTFEDFITQIRVRQLQDPNSDERVILPNEPQYYQTLLSGDSKNTYQIYTNVDNTVKSHGLAVGFDYSLSGYYRLGVNYNWNKLITDLETFQNDFNTPEHKINVSFGNRRLTENLGFNLTYRWQDAFRWESSFVFMDVDAVSTVDAQISYRLPQINSVVKLGGSNILNEQHILNGGGPNLGAVYYISLTYDSVFRR
ncbi:MAG: TonB-dependent receptor [Balneolaceae bacterium]